MKKIITGTLGSQNCTSKTSWKKMLMYNDLGSCHSDVWICLFWTCHFCLLINLLSTSSVHKTWAWILDVMLIALVSNVTLLVWLSNFAQCWLPCARLNPVARIPWAPSTAQILKVTLIETNAISITSSIHAQV